MDTENFSAKFEYIIVLKILQVINSPKYVGITEIPVYSPSVKCLDDPEQIMTYHCLRESGCCTIPKV